VCAAAHAARVGDLMYFVWVDLCRWRPGAAGPCFLFY
jgi:hypothetical protein